MKGINSMQTSIDLKLLNSKLKIDKTYKDGDQYIYRLIKPGRTEKENHYYILKGYKIPVENINDNLGKFMQFINKINCIYKEYYFFKIASSISPYFGKPLGIDTTTKSLPSSSIMIIEILFEDGGESISRFTKVTVDLAYDLMRQSADAISLLNNMDIFQLEINSENLCYDKGSGLLKIMNMEINTNDLFPLMTTQEKQKDSSDSYSWGILFYCILLNKPNEVTKNEFQKHKMNSKSDYMKHIECIKKNIACLKGNDAKKNFITEQITSALSFDPKDRLKMFVIQQRIQEFSKKEGIMTSSIEMSHKQKLKKLLSLESDIKIETVIEVNEGEVNNLMNLGNSMLKYLKDDKIEYKLIGN